MVESSYGKQECSEVNVIDCRWVANKKEIHANNILEQLSLKSHTFLWFLFFILKSSETFLKKD